MKLETFSYKQVLYGKENNQYFILKVENGKVEKEFFNSQEEIKEYINKNERHFI